MSLLERLKGEITTERLLLRRWKSEDFSIYKELMSDPEVMIPAGMEPAKTLDKCASLFAKDRRNDGCFAAVLRETGEIIGRIKFQTDLRRFHVKSLSVCYEFRKEFWGHGYATEALCAMIIRGFEREKLDVLGISHYAENDASRRVIEKCGFRYEGTVHRSCRRPDGKIMDDVCYYLLREDYPAWKKAYSEGLPLLREPKESDS